jgi:hypothetical protein
VKYPNPIFYGSKDIAQVKVFENLIKVQVQGYKVKVLVPKKYLFMRYLYVNYQNPNRYGSKDIAQVKVFVTPTLTSTPGS